MTIKIKHKRSAVSGKAPLPADLEFGEIAVNYEKTDPALYIKDSDNIIRKIGGDATETAKGIVELATAAETTTGTDDTRAVHPAGLKVELDKKVNLAGDTMTGNLTVPSLNGGPLAGFRNAIINGNFDIWQRGTSFTGVTSAGGGHYGVDRWILAQVGTTHITTQQAFPPGQTAVPGEPTYFCRMVVTSVAGAGNFCDLVQRIEDVRTFAGQQVTISFWAKADATKNIAVDLTQFFGSGGSPSAYVTGIGATKVSIGTSWKKVTVTATLPSISGKTLGSDNNHSLNLTIFFDAGSSIDFRTDSLGQQSGTFDIAQVQIEPGPVATPFERRPIGLELALCQRYYQTAGIVLVTTATGRYPSSNFHSSMRVVPTITTKTNTGTGGVVGPIGSGAFWQTTNHSTDSVAYVYADAEIQ